VTTKNPDDMSKLDRQLEALGISREPARKGERALASKDDKARIARQIGELIGLVARKDATHDLLMAIQAGAIEVTESFHVAGCEAIADCMIDPLPEEGP